MEEHTVHFRPPVWLPILVVLIAGGSYVFGKMIETQYANMVTITVQGEGKMTAVPDIASLSFGVETGRMETAEGAMRALAEKMEAIISAVQDVGIEEKDIETQSLSLTPSYDWFDGERIDQGFEARQSLRVKVRDLDKISRVLDVAVRAGANQADSVSFTIDDPDDLRAKARELAIADALAKADVLADQLDIELEEFNGYWEEGGGYTPVPMMERAMSMDMKGVGGGGFAPPIPAGEEEIIVRVNLTYRVD